MEIKKTSLHKLHNEHQAKFVEFAGYEMPIQYKKGVIEEHKFTRSNSGIFDVSHMGQLFIYGNDDLTNDLEKIFPLDLKSLQQNSSKYTFLMNNTGGIYDDLIITKLKEGYLIILNAACKDNDFKILTKLLNNKYKMVLDEERSLIAIQGPKSAKILNQIISGINGLSFMTGNWFNYKDQKIYVTRSGYTGEDGFEISIPNDFIEDLTKTLIEKGARLIGLGARDTLRLEAGLCLYGHDLDINKTPIEANLKWAISKGRISEGGFIGSDIIISQIRDGTKLIRVGIKPEGRLIAREKTKIYDETDTLIGEITSGTFGPSVNGPVAIGYVQKEYSKKDTKVKIEGDVGIIGITQHATEMLGDIVFVELPDVGTSVEKDGNAGVVESTKAASDVYTPISGEVMENNQSIVDDPAKINSDPENQAWFFKLKIKDKSELDSLMNKEEYDKFAKESGN